MIFQEFSELIAKNFPNLENYTSSSTLNGVTYFFLEDPETKLHFIEFNDYMYAVVSSDIHLIEQTLIKNAIKAEESYEDFIIRTIQEHLADIQAAIAKVAEFNIPATRDMLRGLGFKSTTTDLSVWELNIDDKTSVMLDLPWRFYYCFKVTILKSYKAPIRRKFDTLEGALNFLTE